MKRIIITALLLFTFQLAVNAQEKKPEPSRVEASAEIQSAFALSQARITIAQREQEILILTARVILGVPLDWTAKLDGQGKLYFEKPEAVKVGSETKKK